MICELEATKTGMSAVFAAATAQLVTLNTHGLWNQRPLVRSLVAVVCFAYFPFTF